MKMSKRTERVLTGWLGQYCGQVISHKTDSAEYQGEELAWDTVCRYVKMEKVIERTYYTVPELVDMLNECAGTDCYGGNWHFEIDDDGRVYSDDLVGWRVMGWKDNAVT